MKIRMRVEVTGTFHNRDGGVKVGEVVDVDEVSARRYIANKLAEPYAEAENALLEPETESAVVKPRKGRRPRPPAEWHDEKAPGWTDANPED